MCLSLQPDLVNLKMFQVCICTILKGRERETDHMRWMCSVNKNQENLYRGFFQTFRYCSITCHSGRWENCKVENGIKRRHSKHSWNSETLFWKCCIHVFTFFFLTLNRDRSRRGALGPKAGRNMYCYGWECSFQLRKYPFRSVPLCCSGKHVAWQWWG